jgi:hypothetical protein
MRKVARVVCARGAPAGREVIQEAPGAPMPVCPPGCRLVVSDAGRVRWDYRICPLDFLNLIC